MQTAPALIGIRWIPINSKRTCLARERRLLSSVTKIVNDVRIFHPSASARKAKVGDVIKDRRATLQTGHRSRQSRQMRNGSLVPAHRGRGPDGRGPGPGAMNQRGLLNDFARRLHRGCEDNPGPPPPPGPSPPGGNPQCDANNP